MTHQQSRPQQTGFVVSGDQLSLEDLWRVAHQSDCRLVLAERARQQMIDSRRYISERIEQGETIYGVNTGFGAFSQVRISPAEIVQLQKNLLRSHSAGVGEPFTLEQARAIMLLRANALARGHSGVRPEVVEFILRCLERNLIPVIPQQGSVGASGDLAPLSHLALALIGEGEMWSPSGEILPAAEVLGAAKFKPLELQAKEGLSLINGCQVMTALGMLSAYRFRRLLWAADLAGAMSLEALRGSRRAFNPLIFATRPHPGEAKTARNLLRVLGDDSEIGRSHDQCTKVQDAYSLRCMPAVHGAAKDVLVGAIAKLEIEANSSTDNPLVFAADKQILSCGNFHGEPIAFTLDFLAIALTALAGISQCRIEKLINPAMSELPAFLAPQGGLNSGHMIVQVSAASLVSECKILSHPASVDSIPTSADKEDHVSMGTTAARKLAQIVANSEAILAMEFLSACQALDLLRPLRSSPVIEAVFARIRQEVPFAEHDRVFARDIGAIQKMLVAEALLETATQLVGPFEL